MKILLLLLLFLCGCWPHQKHRPHSIQMPKGEEEIGPDEITFQFLPTADNDTTPEWE